MSTDLATATNHQIRLAARPVGLPKDSDWSFTEEPVSLPAEGGLEFKGSTLLFTDLKGSTVLYERLGDLRAYELVRQHFAVLRSIAAAAGGSIVKTIGDAVMASFADPLAAMHAVTRMHQAIEQLGEGELHLKIGVHSGSCIAVELNDRLDYFGRTVNIAARVQGHKDGFGFAVPGDGSADLYLGAREMRKVFDGDLVLVRKVGEDRRGRPEGVIVEVVEHLDRRIGQEVPV